MYTYLYLYAQILGLLGFFAVPLIVLKYGVLIRTVKIAKNYRQLKADGRAGRTERAGIIIYSILAALLWLPLIILSLWADIKDGHTPYFSIVKNWYIEGRFIIQGIALAVISAIITFRGVKRKAAVWAVSFIIYALSELLLTYMHTGLLQESILTLVGGVFLSVGAGSLTGATLYKNHKPKLT